MKDWTKVELNTSLSFGSMRKTTEALIEKFQQELDRLSSIGEFVEVKSHQSKC